MSTCVPAEPECSTSPDLTVAATGTTRTSNIPGEPNCRTVDAGADQTTIPDPSN